MKRSAVLAVGLAVVASAATTSLAFATPPTGPDSQACTDAKTELAAAVAPVVDYSPNVYPGDVVPALADVDGDLLDAMLADTDLGGDARVEVEAAAEAVLLVDLACAPAATPAPTTAPAPTTVPESTVAPTLAPDTDDDDFDQVGRPPAGGVQTGAR